MPQTSTVCGKLKKYLKKEINIMKKLLIITAAACLALVVTGCGSLRTPKSGPRSKNVYYATFFGISLESAVYGDGLVVNPMK